MLTNLKIGLRIAIALIVPTLGMLAFSAVMLVERSQVSSEVEELRSLVGLGPTVSALVHEMQKERGMSAGFIGSKGKKFADALPKQRATTDQKRQAAIQALQGFDATTYGAVLQSKFKTALEAVGQLDTSRSSVSSFSFSVPQMAKYYTGTIAKLLSIVEETAVLSSDAKMTSLIVTYTSFLQAKERAGVERAMGTGGFGAGKFAPAIHKRFVELIAQQRAFLGIFTVYGTPELKSYYDTTVKGKAVDEVARMREIAINNPQTNTTGGVDATYWYETITAKINLLKKVEDEIAKEIDVLGASIQGKAEAEYITVLSISIILLGIAIALSLVIVRGITGPLGRMTTVMGVLANGDMTVDIPGIGRGDEIGSMAGAVEVFKVNMIKADELAELEKVAVVRRENRAKAIDGLLTKFNDEVTEALQIVSSAATEMEATSKAMSQNAEHTSEQATAVAAASEEAAANVETVASAAEELGASVNEINRQIRDSEAITDSARKESAETNSMVNGLSQSVAKIGDVVNLINDIAEQTNLLALNATIEAARAGDAGKGFAVVASEVKNLANQTGKATDEIAKQIQEVQDVTTRSVAAISKVTGIVDQMGEISSAIAAAIEEQGAAVQEIARNVQQAAAGTQDVNRNITGVSNAASETGNSAIEVLETAKSVSERSTLLRDQVDTFLTNVKTAQ